MKREYMAPNGEILRLVLEDIMTESQLTPSPSGSGDEWDYSADNG